MKAPNGAASSDRLERAERRYRLLLRLLPGGFRREAEPALVAMFRGRYPRGA